LTGKWIFCAGIIGLALTLPGFADVVNIPFGSTAGPTTTTPYDLTGDPNPTEIIGTLDPTDGVALFEIDILHPLYFSAYTIFTGANGIPDPELFLFDSGGNAVYMNDDVSNSPVDTQSCLPSSISIVNPCPTTSGLGPQTAGDYFLAITFSLNSPQDSGPNYLFQAGSSTDVLGPAGAGPLAGWDSTFVDFDNANYDIIISDAPEPAAWPVTLAVGLGLVFFRRKLRAQ
jgi:hypothetical protein